MTPDCGFIALFWGPEKLPRQKLKKPIYQLSNTAFQ
jgi:hypothetical protein